MINIKDYIKTFHPKELIISADDLFLRPVDTYVSYYQTANLAFRSSLIYSTILSHLND